MTRDQLASANTGTRPDPVAFIGRAGISMNRSVTQSRWLSRYWCQELVNAMTCGLHWH